MATAPATASAKPQRRLAAYTGELKDVKLLTKADAQDLPDGCCGRVVGVALVYGVTDSQLTQFARGALARTIADKVQSGKVQFYSATDDARHQYGTRTHIGVVRAIQDVGDAAVMTADLFDTAEGRAAKEYVDAVLKAGGWTGLSVGGYDRKGEVKRDGDGDPFYEYQEFELREITLTPFPAVPGANVMAVRTEGGSEPEQRKALLTRALEGIVLAIGPDAAAAEVARLAATHQHTPPTQATTDSGDAGAAHPSPDSHDAGRRPDKASMAERMTALRATY